MTLLYKRPDSTKWYVTQTRECTGTTNRKDAEEFARSSLAKKWRQDKLGETHCTFAQLGKMWMDDKSEKRSLKEDARVIRDFCAFLKKRELGEATLGQIDSSNIKEYAKQVKLRASPSTANCHLRIIRAMLNYAVAEEIIAVRPPIKLLEATPKARVPVTAAQSAAISANLVPWVRDMFVFAGQTGLRWANVVGLMWEWVSTDPEDAGLIVRVPAIAAKTNRMYVVALSTRAQEILARRWEEGGGTYTGLVFWNPEKPRVRVREIRTQWQRALANAGIDDMCWHAATRHTWASMHTMNGTPDRVIQEMAGWSSPAMLQKYVHLKTEHLVSYANNVNKQPQI